MKVKVWNKNTYPYTEVFNGDKISIGPGEFIMMDYHEAIDFRGTCNGILRDFDGQPDPKGFKMIVVERPQEEIKVSTLNCPKCGKIMGTNRELEVHIDENHLDDLEDQELAQKRRGRPKKDAA